MQSRSATFTGANKLLLLELCHVSKFPLITTRFIENGVELLDCVPLVNSGKNERYQLKKPHDDFVTNILPTNICTHVNNYYSIMKLLYSYYLCVNNKNTFVAQIPTVKMSTSPNYLQALLSNNYISSLGYNRISESDSNKLSIKGILK